VLLAALSILSAALATLSLPSFDFGFLGWIAIAPLLFALRQRGLLAGALLGGLFGCVFGTTSFFWINSIPDINSLRFALLVAAFSVYYLLFGFLYAFVSRPLRSWLIVVGPALWVALEYARGSMSFLAYPWNFLGHSQHSTLAVIQIADMTGAYGVSFLLAMASQLVSELPELRSAARSWRLAGGAFAVVLGATLLYGWQKLGDPVESGRLRVAIVQANVAARAKMSTDEQMKHLGAYAELTMEAAKERPELVVWPSSSLPAPISFWMIRFYVSELANNARVRLLVGGAGGDKFAPARTGELPYSNSEILISPKGTLEGQYNKVHLTPFTEQVPLQGLVTWPRWMTTLEKSFVPGNGYTLFQVGEARFGTPICWENSFPDLFRRFVLAGANFMVSATSESVFGPTAGPQQTLAMNVFRAVENRVAVARAATTGVSAFIDSRGRIVSKVADARGVDLFVAGHITWDVPLSSERTFYTLYGDVFAQCTTLLAVVALLFGAWLRRGYVRERT
jgi:apolipoprotein N-acyltransferase